MVNIPIKLGTCSCLMGFYNPYSKVCWQEYAIYLGKELTEAFIFYALNHEYLHVVIAKLEGIETSVKFDRIFTPSTKIEEVLFEDGTLC